MDIFDGLVPSDNMLSSLNFDAIDISGLYPSHISSCNSLFDHQMWTDPSTCIQESKSNHNVSPCNNEIPFSSNSIPSTCSTGNEWDSYLHGGSVGNPSFDSTFHESSNQQGLEGFSSADDILQLVCDAGLDSVLNDDLLKCLVADLPANSSQSSITNLINANGRSSDLPSYNNALAGGFGMHPGYHRTEESLENVVMAPLPKKGLFSQLGLDQLLSNKAGSSSSAKCSNEDQFSSPKRQRMNCYTAIGRSYSADAKSCVIAQAERVEESSKGTKKRAKPGESTKPRPKDRQMIQDRLKELREIIPNGAKCSIDSLLERTIKHVVFMQGVMKYGDKLKKVDEFKTQRGNGNGGISGSAAWAIEVGGQNPIVVEDIGHSGQMLIEMLCKEQGFFLEIADVIRGFGLTILKGVVEARDDKIWAHFIVESNRDVTRMQVLMSLLQLLQDTSTSPLKTKTIGDENRVVGNNNSSLLNNNYHHQPMMNTLPIGLADPLR